MRLRLVVLCIALSLTGIAVAVVAVTDHHRSRARSNRAQLAEWYCTHQGTRCGGPSSVRMHEAWENRELGYKVTEGTLAGVVLLTAGLIVLPRRRA
ncbi:MAG TPA: hypothetical protein VF025_05470 [Gaiellaceae bacterium]